ncbi:MAG: hypothetical protein V3T84_14610 [Phycisphaerales bacterium]
MAQIESPDSSPNNESISSGPLSFYWQWCRGTFTRPFLIADSLAGGLALVGSFIASLKPQTQFLALAWQIPLSAFVLLVLVQFIRAPYLIHRAQERRHTSKLTEVENERDRLAAQIKERITGPPAHVGFIKQKLARCIERCKQAQRGEWQPTHEEAFEWRAKVAEFLRAALISGKYADDLCSPHHKLLHFKEKAQPSSFLGLAYKSLSFTYDHVRPDEIAPDFEIQKWDDWEP